MVITDLRGNRSVATLVKTFSSLLKVNYVILLANTVSPTIVGDIAKSGSRIVGVAGNLDDPSVIDAFKKHGIFVESRILNLNGLRTFFTGLAFNESLRNISKVEQVDIFITYYPGFKHSCCCNGYVKAVDSIIDSLKPRLVVTGKCMNPCYNGYVASPGQGYLGYSLIIDYSNNYWLKFVNLWDTLYSKLSV